MRRPGLTLYSRAECGFSEPPLHCLTVCVCTSALVHVHSGQLDPLDLVFDMGSERLASDYPLQQGRAAAVERDLRIFSSFLRPEFSPVKKPLCSHSFGKTVVLKGCGVHACARVCTEAGWFLWKLSEQCYKHIEKESLEGEEMLTESRLFLVSADLLCRTQDLGKGQHPPSQVHDLALIIIFPCLPA